MMNSELDLDFTIQIHGARGFSHVTDTDLDRLPFRMTLLHNADKVCIDASSIHKQSCHNVFIHSSSQSQWYVDDDDKEPCCLISRLDPESKNVHLRLDLHGIHFRMFTISLDLETIQRYQYGKRIWWRLAGGEGEENHGEIQMAFSVRNVDEITNPTKNKGLSIQGKPSITHTTSSREENICKYSFTIQIQDISGICGDDNRPNAGDSLHWISYEFLGNIEQTDQFSPSDISTIPSIPTQFQFYGDQHNIAKSLLNNEDMGLLKVYVCSDMCIRASFNVRLGALFCSNDTWNEHQRLQEGSKDIIANLADFGLHGESEDRKCSIPSNNDKHDPKLHLLITLKIQPQALQKSTQRYQYLAKEMNTKNPPEEIIDKTSSADFPLKRICSPIESVHFMSKVRDEVANASKEAQAQMDEKKKQWTIFKRKEEESFRKHLRQKEGEVRKFLQQRIQKNEDDHASAMKACRSEYLKLESRLKKALAGVESKEREMKRKLDEADSLHEKKMAELELQEKMLRKETKHSLEVEVTKLQAALKEVEGLKNRAQEAEKALAKARKRHQDSEGGQAEREISRLRGCLADTESMLKRERVTKDEIVAEQEHYRVAAHKLAKLVRQERKKQTEIPLLQQKQDEETLSERNTNESMNELHRIKAELTSLVDSEDNSD